MNIAFAALTKDEYNQKTAAYPSNPDKLFADGKSLETDIKQ